MALKPKKKSNKRLADAKKKRSQNKKKAPKPSKGKDLAANLNKAKPTKENNFYSKARKIDLDAYDFGGIEKINISSVDEDEALGVFAAYTGCSSCTSTC